jgi:hypothetical protein
MKHRLLVLVALVTLLAPCAGAQDVYRYGLGFIFSGTGGALQSGTAAPEGAVTGNPGDVYYRTGASAALYLKASGTGNTGWVVFPRTDTANAWTGDQTFAADAFPSTTYHGNLGKPTAKWLTVNAAELLVETLVAQDTVATIGGRILVGPTTTLTADIDGTVTTISVKHNTLTSGDVLYLEAAGKVEYMTVTSGASGAGPYTYSVTRNIDGSGGDTWSAGAAVFNTRQTGYGLIDLYSNYQIGNASGLGPTICGDVRTGATYNALSARWCAGNLRDRFNYGANTVYGFAAGDPAGTHITADATNGFRIRNGTTDLFKADASGNLALSGNLTASGSGSFVAGHLTLGTGGVSVPMTTAWYDDRAYRFTSTWGGTHGLGSYEDGTNRITFVSLTSQPASSASAASTGVVTLNAQGVQANSAIYTGGASISLYGSGAAAGAPAIGSGYVSVTADKGDLRVNTDLGLSIPSQPRARYYLNANQTIGNAADTALAWTARSASPSTSGTWTAAGAGVTAIYPPANGGYLVTAQATFVGGNVGIRKVSVQLNGAAVCRQEVTPNTTTHAVSLPCVIPIASAGSDYISVVVYQSQGGNLDVYGSDASNTALTIVKIW